MNPRKNLLAAAALCAHNPLQQDLPPISGRADMKKLLLLLPLVALVGLTLAWARSGSARGFAAPTECAEAYYRAVKDADATAYLDCLTDELRQRHADRAALASDLRARGRDLRGWAVFATEPAPGEGTAVWVDAQLAAGRRRQQLIVAQVGSGWRVARVAPARDVPDDIPFGTHVSQVETMPSRPATGTDDD